MDNLDFLFTWMQTPNPMLGGAVPLEMMERGYGNKLAQFIRQAIEDEEAAKAFMVAHSAGASKTSSASAGQ